MLKRILLLALAIGLLAPMMLADITVQVGYADNLRPSPFFPNPWKGGTTYFVGSGNPGCTAINGDTSCYDAGAILLTNTGGLAAFINGITVDVHGNLFSLWGSATLNPGQSVILTQTLGSYNFDTSDYPITDQAHPCLGLATDPAVCGGSNIPTVSFSVNGSSPLTFLDTAHVLDTGGFDEAGANPCLNPSDPAGNCNESLNWRPIGTTGINNPAGVPEPASLVLFGSGLLGLGTRAWKRFIG